MDQRAYDVEEDLKKILHTRQSLEHKIVLLEKRVEETVQGTKAVALATLDFATSKAVDFIESALYHMNPTVQAAKRPWILLGGAIASGFVAGLMAQRRQAPGTYPYNKREETSVQLPAHQSFDRPEWPRKRTASLRSQRWIPDLWRPLFSVWDDLAGELTEERVRLQRAVLYAGHSFIRDVTHIIGQTLLDQLNRPRPMSQRHGQPWNHK